MVKLSHFISLLCLLILGACASGWGEQSKKYREAFINNDFDKAAKILEKSDLKKDKESLLLWHMEKGTVALERSDENSSIRHLEAAQKMIDDFYTISIKDELKRYLLNDRSGPFYGASYERSYTYYYLARAYYARYLKSGNKLDLQGARAMILAWDTYFTDYQRSASIKTLYHTDLMLKIFGGEIHEVSGVRNDKQIALQLYKDALKILNVEGGVFTFFNKDSVNYIRDNEKRLKDGKSPSDKYYKGTSGKEDLQKFLNYKILSLTKEIRGGDFDNQVKALKASSEIVKRARTFKANVVLVLEEGLIPPKIGKTFNFGLKGAIDAVEDPQAKKFIRTVGAEFLTAFAMNKLGLIPSQTASPGSFVFAHSVTKLGVQEAAIEFELPMIENVPLVQRQEIFILDEKGIVIAHNPLPVVSENGDIARVVLEEDVVSRYIETGTRVAIQHILAIVSAMQVYQKFSKSGGGDLIATSAAIATYVGAAKGIALLEKADTRYWATLPQAMRMAEFELKPGKYTVAVGLYSGDTPPLSPNKNIGEIEVKNSDKALYHLKFQSP